MSDQPPPPMTEMAALKVPFKIGPENLSSNPAVPLRHFFNFHNCFALGDLTKVQVQAGRSVKHELHLTGRCRIMSVCPDTHGNQHVSALDATIRDGAAHIDAQHPATLMSVTISPSGSIMELSIGNPRQVSYTAHIAHSGVARGGGFIAKFGLKPFQETPTLDKGFVQADIDRVRDIDSVLEKLKRADANLRDAKKRLESARTSLAAFDKMSPEQRSAKESVITQKQKTVSDAQRDIAQIEEIRRVNFEHQLTAERTAILSKAPQSVALTMFERGEITWSSAHWVYPTIDLHQPHFAVDGASARYGKHVDTVSQESGFEMQVTHGHNLFVRHLPGKPISLDVTMDRPSHERPTEAMTNKATMFMPLLAHAEEVFKRDNVPFLEIIAQHRIPADCTPQQLSGHLTFIDARWRTLAMRPLPPAHHPPSVLSFWKSKAASPSSSVLVKQLAKRQLWDKLLKLPDTDAGRQRPISSCVSLRCTPMHHAPQCMDPMFCPANRAVSLTFTYPNHTTNLRAQFDLRHELLRASAPVASAPVASAAVASAAAAPAPKASAAPKAPAALGASAAAAPAPAASRKRASSAAPKSASKKLKQGGSRTRRRLRR